jgi:hypothetical protein
MSSESKEIINPFKQKKVNKNDVKVDEVEKTKQEQFIDDPDIYSFNATGLTS